MNVSSDEEENFLASVGRRDEDEDEDALFEADYRSVVADFRPGERELD